MKRSRSILDAKLGLSGYDYDVEVMTFPGSITVVLHGDRMRWFDEEARVMKLLRDTEDEWRGAGVLTRYSFIARDALVA